LTRFPSKQIGLNTVRRQRTNPSTRGVFLRFKLYLGVRADIDIFRDSKPDFLRKDDVILGDKAYLCKDEPQLLAPVKANSLEMKADPEGATAKSTLINWYRSTIEHLFAHMKVFNILGSRLRLHNALDQRAERRLRCAISIIIVLIFKRIRRAAEFIAFSEEQLFETLELSRVMAESTANTTATASSSRSVDASAAASSSSACSSSGSGSGSGSGSASASASAVGSIRRSTRLFRPRV